mgnify:CR=1 FL=1
MNYRCPKCQSSQIMPVASASGVRPVVPKSLVTLIPSVLILVLLVVVSLVFLIIDKEAGPVLQGATILAFLSVLVSGFMFWKAMPDFKISMQSFMQSQKHWKCRQCNHDWHNQ